MCLYMHLLVSVVAMCVHLCLIVSICVPVSPVGTVGTMSTQDTVVGTMHRHRMAEKEKSAFDLVFLHLYHLNFPWSSPKFGVYLKLS